MSEKYIISNIMESNKCMKQTKDTIYIFAESIQNGHLLLFLFLS